MYSKKPKEKTLPKHSTKRDQMRDLRAVDKLFICNELNNQSAQSVQQVLIASGVVWHSSIASCNIKTKTSTRTSHKPTKTKQITQPLMDMNNSQNVTDKNTIELYAVGFESNII